MSEVQKMIKYFAIAFAIFLSVNIIGGIITAIFFGLSIFGITLGIQDATMPKETSVTSQEITSIQNYEDIENLKIEVGYSKLTIKEASELKVEATNGKTLEVRKSGDTLSIKDNKVWNLFNEQEQNEIILTLPKGLLLEKVKVDAGSGELTISNLQAKDLDFDVGAGNVTISNIVVEKKADIDGGAGRVVLQNSTLNNLDLDVGVGEFQIQNTKLVGNSDIDAGVGKLEINLKGSLEDYSIIPKRGLGSFTLQREEVEDNKTYGEGQNRIKVDAGVGKVEINIID